MHNYQHRRSKSTLSDFVVGHKSSSHHRLEGRTRHLTIRCGDACLKCAPTILCPSSCQEAPISHVSGSTVRNMCPNFIALTDQVLVLLARRIGDSWHSTALDLVIVRFALPGPRWTGQAVLQFSFLGQAWIAINVVRGPDCQCHVSPGPTTFLGNRGVCQESCQGCDSPKMHLLTIMVWYRVLEFDRSHPGHVRRCPQCLMHVERAWSAAMQLQALLVCTGRVRSVQLPFLR